MPARLLLLFRRDDHDDVARFVHLPLACYVDNFVGAVLKPLDPVQISLLFVKELLVFDLKSPKFALSRL